MHFSRPRVSVETAAAYVSMDGLSLRQYAMQV